MTRADFAAEHLELTRRYFLQLGTLTTAAIAGMSLLHADEKQVSSAPRAKPNKAGAFSDPYFTPAADFRDVSRGKPVPHTLSEEQKREVGLTRDTWQLEVISDSEYPAKLRNSLTRSDGTALDFAGLMKLAETHAVRFPKVISCLNLGCPLGMGLWEGVPLREIVWLTQPRENVRRVFYYGFHNANPDQMFRSSLPIGRVLEDPLDLPPVILCYKLNGDWLDSERGGPVRIVVPEAYGFKSIKWLTHVVLTNRPTANDTYAEQNNDIDSPMKTFAATLVIPTIVESGAPIAVSGYAQVGVSGLSKVQVCIESKSVSRPDEDPGFATAPWVDAELLPAPTHWGAVPDGQITQGTFGFDSAGQPKTWPLGLTNAHWAAVLPGLPTGEYTFRCRSIDQNGHAQPMPRPFRKSGHAAIESVGITVRES